MQAAVIDDRPFLSNCLSPLVPGIKNDHDELSSQD